MDLPKGWVSSALHDVVRLINGDRGKNYPAKDKLTTDSDSGLPFVSALNLDNGRIKQEGLLFLTEKQYELLGNGKFQKGDMIFCLRGSLGKNAVSQLEKGAIASSLVILRPYTTEPLLRYIESYINSPLLFTEIKRYDNGTAQPNLSARNLAVFRFPLPPLAEQHRIVTKIDALFSKLDKGAETLQTIRLQLRTYRQAVLKWAFEGKLSDIAWEMSTIDQIADKIKIGPFGTLLHKADYISDGVPIANPKHMVNYKIVPENDKTISRSKAEELSSYLICENDVLIARRGEMGRTAYVSSKENGWLCGTGSMIIRFPKDYSGYLYTMLLSAEQPRKFLADKSNGTTMDNLNETIIKRMPFPQIPVGEQDKLLNEIESRLSVCDKLESIIDENLAKTAALRQSILKKAFTGQLVPQDPDDEPADKLLERIKAAKAAAMPTKKPASTRRKRNG